MYKSTRSKEGKIYELHKKNISYEIMFVLDKNH